FRPAEPPDQAAGPPIGATLKVRSSSLASSWRSIDSQPAGGGPHRGPGPVQSQGGEPRQGRKAAALSRDRDVCSHPGSRSDPTSTLITETATATVTANCQLQLSTGNSKLSTSEMSYQV